MPPLNRMTPYAVAAAVLFMITFYHVFNVKSKNSDLERSVKVHKEALQVSKEKNKVLVKDALEKIDKKDARIKELEQENLSKHTKLGTTQQKLAKLRMDLDSKNNEIKMLHQSAADHKSEIATLSQSVLKSKEVLTKLSEKADHLMVDHKKLKKENTELEQQNEKLKNDINQQQLEISRLHGQLTTLTKEKQGLGQKVDNLKKKNEIIEESIRQKIKESYDNHRMMILHPTPTTKETEDEQAVVKTTQDSTHTGFTHGHNNFDEEQKTLVNNADQLLESMVNTSNMTQSNVSNILRHQSEDVQGRSVSKFIVNNSESEETLQQNSDTVDVNTNTTMKRNFVDKNTIQNGSLAERASENATAPRDKLDQEQNENNVGQVKDGKMDNQKSGKQFANLDKDEGINGQLEDGTIQRNINLHDDKHFEKTHPIGNIDQLNKERLRSYENLPEKRFALPDFSKTGDDMTDRQSLR